jgi:hypothetical protein
MSKYLQLAKKLQTTPGTLRNTFDYGVDIHLIPKTLHAMSQVIHIPTRFHRHFKEEENINDRDIKDRKIRNQSESLDITKLQPKPLRHKPKQDSLLELSPKNYGKKLNRIENALREILETRQLAKTLRVDKWTISSLTLSANERICFVWWKLDESVPKSNMQQEIVRVCLM